MRIEVDCDRIRRNAEAVIVMCNPHHIEVVGVTKACGGDPDIARAMLAGGVKSLAESRLKNIQRFREANIEVPMMLLRLPNVSEAGQVVRLAQVSLNSEIKTVRALSKAAQENGLTHQVILMVEMGDRREGVLPDEALDTARAIAKMPNIELIGIGTNLSCLCGVLPTKEKTESLINVAEDIENDLGIQLRVISSGHTSDLELIVRGEMPERVNQLRIGEAILLGVNCHSDYPLPLPHQDAFKVFGEVIEVNSKPSTPDGIIGRDAFGHGHQWQDLGIRKRALVSIGEQDLRIDGLHPKRPGLKIVGASSDLMVIDVTEATSEVNVGDELEFDQSYTAVATAMVNCNVTKVIKPAKFT
jgi:predicted amino acid racemase